jgi:hypothetical protein
MKFLVFMFLSFTCVYSTNVFAKKYWFNMDNDWEIYFDNAKTYVRSPSLNLKCNYSRAFLSPTYGDDAYRNRMYAYILTASSTNKKLSIVLDESQDKSNGGDVRCQFYGANSD